MSSKESKLFWDSLGSQSGQAAAVDPKDTKGLKNAYISLVRDYAIIESLGEDFESEILLDFGTGTGTFLSKIKTLRPSICAVGTDVSLVMLKHALVRDPDLSGSVFLYDGKRFPIRDGCVDAITTGGVLLYFTNEADFIRICREFERILRPGGKVVVVEQVRGRSRLDSKNMKVQRTPAELQILFGKAGLQCISWRQVRRARFPIIYAVRYGLIPRSWHGPLARLESKLWAKAWLPMFDYADAVLTFSKAKY